MHSITKLSKTARHAATVDPVPYVRTQAAPTLPESAAAANSIVTGSFDLVRKFVDHLVVKNAAGSLGEGGSGHHKIDWAAVEASTSDCLTLEQAIGRTVLVADKISRGGVERTRPADFPSPYDANDPFFAFSVADVAPDFGDESRYRRRAVRKLVQILRNRNLVVASS